MFPQLENILYGYNHQLEICCSLDFPEAYLETNILARAVYLRCDPRKKQLRDKEHDTRKRKELIKSVLINKFSLWAIKA